MGPIPAYLDIAFIHGARVFTVTLRGGGVRAGESCTCETSSERGGAIRQARVVNLHGAGLMLVGCTCPPVQKSLC